MPRLINCTPHPLTLRDTDGTDHVLDTSDAVARITSIPGELHDLGLPVPVAEADTWGDVVDLPAPKEGTFYIVSALVGSALRGTRDDLLVPGTGPHDNCVRDGGRILAVTRLKRP